MRKHRTLTPEHKAKISAANKRLHKTVSPEQRAKMVAGHKALWENRPRKQQYYRKFPPKNWGTILSPDGVLYDVINLAKFCREHSLSQPCLKGVFEGWAIQHKGWTLPTQPKADRDIKEWGTVIDPWGNEYKVVGNLAVFARQHDLDANGLHRVLHGKSSHHRRWTIDGHEVKRCHSLETRAKISAALKGRSITVEGRAKMSAAKCVYWAQRKQEQALLHSDITIE